MARDGRSDRWTDSQVSGDGGLRTDLGGDCSWLPGFSWGHARAAWGAVVRIVEYL